MMKDFDENISRVEMVSEMEIRRELRREIANKPMTESERETAINQSILRARGLAAEANAKHHDDQNRLTELFWHDCREDLGYDRFLTDDGIGTLEAEAWDRGHSAGYSEVYQCLIRLCEFVEKLVKGIKPGVSL